MATNITGTSPKQLNVMTFKSSISSSYGSSGFNFYNVNGNKKITPAKTNVLANH